MGGSKSSYAGKVTPGSLTMQAAPKLPTYQKMSLQDVARKALNGQ